MIASNAPAAEITRENFWMIGQFGEVVFYILSTLAILLFLYGIVRRVTRYLRAGPDRTPRLNRMVDRFLSSLKTAGSNETNFYQDLFAGLMHLFIMWGFVVLFIGTTILFFDMDLYRPLLGSSFWTGDFYLSYSFVLDALGLLFVVGCLMAMYRRYVVHSGRLWHKHTSWEDDLFIWSLFLLGVTGFLPEALRILGTGFPSFEKVSFVGWFTARVLQVGGYDAAWARWIQPYVWWTHAALALGFVAWLPYAKPFHMVSSYLNIVFQDERRGIRLEGVPPEQDPEEIGYVSIEDLSWKQQLDLDACTKCGRCTSVCPAHASGRPLDPRNVILDLKEGRDRWERGDLDGIPVISRSEDSLIAAETMDACLSCMACVDACPVAIEHVPQFTEMNRRLVESGQMEPNLEEVMMTIFQKGNSFGESARKRADWTEQLEFEVEDAREQPVEYLWYVGDYPSYDPAQKKVARSLARLFEDAGVDYGILYEDEKNDGNDVRRIGEEGLFEMLVEDNVNAFEKCDYEKIVCTDPHAFNTFKNEYPDFDWDAKPVLHYTQVLEQLFQSGRLDLRGDELDYVVTYHDPCHLGRFNDVYETPRKMIEATGCELFEMPRNRSNSFCCGGGGGGLWAEFDDEPKPSEERLREAVEDTDAGSRVQKFVVACPMCGTMYEDGRKTGGFEEELEIVDLAELVIEAIEVRENATAV